MCAGCEKDMREEGLPEGRIAEIMALLDAMFGEPEPVVDYFEKHNLASEYDLSGVDEEFGPWMVKVCKVPEDTPEDSELFGYDWVQQGYHEGNLVASNVGRPPEPCTAEWAAEVFAEYHFDYVI